MKSKNASSDITVACYTFPGFHPSSLNRTIFGTEWSEYVLMRQGRPWYPGHDQPKCPALGELDESKPGTWEVYNDLASRHGVDVFIHDWYWLHQGPAMHEALEDGFLKSANCNDMKFAVMWTDHDWPRWIETFNADGTYSRPCAAKSPTHHIEEIYQSMAYILSRYLHLPNYWRIDGKPVLVIFWPFIIEDVSRTRKILDDIRELAVKMGHKGLHLHASHGGLEMKETQELGFDSYAHYNPLGDIGSHRPVTEEVIDYPTLVGDIVKTYWPKWNTIHDLPFFPTVAPGFDLTPRLLPRTRSEGPADRNQWPGCIILNNDTPKAFGDFVRAGVEFIETNKIEPRVLMMGCWNEWTEGHYLLPDLKYGYGKLEALAQALGVELQLRNAK